MPSIWKPAWEGAALGLLGGFIVSLTVGAPWDYVFQLAILSAVVGYFAGVVHQLVTVRNRRDT